MGKRVSYWNRSKRFRGGRAPAAPSQRVQQSAPSNHAEENHVWKNHVGENHTEDKKQVAALELAKNEPPPVRILQPDMDLCVALCRQYEKEPEYIDGLLESEYGEWWETASLVDRSFANQLFLSNMQVKRYFYPSGLSDDSGYLSILPYRHPKLSPTVIVCDQSPVGSVRTDCAGRRIIYRVIELLHNPPRLYLRLGYSTGQALTAVEAFLMELGPPE